MAEYLSDRELRVKRREALRERQLLEPRNQIDQSDWEADRQLERDDLNESVQEMPSRISRISECNTVDEFLNFTPTSPEHDGMKSVDEAIVKLNRTLRRIQEEQRMKDTECTDHSTVFKTERKDTPTEEWLSKSATVQPSYNGLHASTQRDDLVRNGKHDMIRTSLEEEIRLDEERQRLVDERRLDEELKFRKKLREEKEMLWLASENRNKKESAQRSAARDGIKIGELDKSERLKRFEEETRKEMHTEVLRQNELKRLNEQRRMEREVIELRKRIEMEMQEELREEVRRKIKEEEKQREVQMKEILRRERREKKMKEEQDLLNSIRSLRLQEQDICFRDEVDENNDKDQYDSEDDEFWGMDFRIKELRREKEMIQDRIQQRLDVQTENKSIPDKSERSLNFPRIPRFDGTMFEEWRHELSSLIGSGLYQERILAQAIRNSVTGKARQVLLTLRPSATTREILKKMDDIYGNIKTADSIVQELYSAKQRQEESCSDWSVRLEALVNQAVESGELQSTRKESKLKERFWKGLQDDRIKIATRNTYESNASFDQLRKKARFEEMELGGKPGVVDAVPKTGNREVNDSRFCQPLLTNTAQTKLDELLKRMASLEADIKAIKTKDSESEIHQQNWRFQSRGRRPGRFPRYPRGPRQSRDYNSASRWRADQTTSEHMASSDTKYPSPQALNANESPLKGKRETNQKSPQK